MKPTKKYQNKFNTELYQKIKTMKNKYSNDIVAGHELTNQKIVHIASGKVYTIQSVHKMWSNGYFLCLLTVNDNNSHSQIFWENINSEDEFILNCIEESKFKYSVIS